MLESGQVPSQVQADADKADALIAAQLAAENGETPPEEDPNATQDPELKPEEDADKDLVNNTKEAMLGSQVKDLTHQLSVLQGKYNAEIKALGDDPQLLNTLKADVKRLTRQNNDYSKIISDQQHELATKVVAKPETPAEAATDAVTELSQDDKDLLKSEGLEGPVLEVINKLVDNRADAIVKTRYGDLSAKVDTVQQENVATKGDRFLQDLTDAVPTWKTINGWGDAGPEAGWPEYLNEMAPFQDRTLGEVLKEAQGQGNVQTCADIFNGFIAKKGTTPPEPKPDDPVVADPLKKLNPADLLDPAASGASELPKDAPTYTKADYKKFYEDATKDQKIMKTEAWQKKRDAIEKALLDGRIIN